MPFAGLRPRLEPILVTIRRDAVIRAADVLADLRTQLARAGEGKGESTAVAEPWRGTVAPDDEEA